MAYEQPQPQQQPYMQEPQYDQRMQQPYMQNPQFIQQQGQYSPSVQQPYMQMPPPVQPYYGQYAMMEQQKKPSVFSKIIGVLLILLGLPLTLLFGLATLGMISGASEGGWVAGLVMLFLTLLSGCLILIGIKQFRPRKSKNLPYIPQPMAPQYNMPPYPQQMQQTNVPPQWGGYPQQPQQNGFMQQPQQDPYAQQGQFRQTGGAFSAPQSTGAPQQPAWGDTTPPDHPAEGNGGGVDLTKR